MAYVYTFLIRSVPKIVETKQPRQSIQATNKSRFASPGKVQAARASCASDVPGWETMSIHSPVKYVAGFKESKARGQVRARYRRRIYGKKVNHIELNIPPDSIAQVGYVTSSKIRGWAWLKSARAAAQGGCSGAGSDYCGTAEALLLVLHSGGSGRPGITRTLFAA